MAAPQDRRRALRTVRPAGRSAVRAVRAAQADGRAGARRLQGVATGRKGATAERDFMSQASSTIDKIYDLHEGSPTVFDFCQRHGVESLNVLTILREQEARENVARFTEHIAGRRVVEIGGGVGYLAMEMAKVARSVMAIENDPAWSWVFTKFPYARKPPNLTWIFGLSEGLDVRADVAVVCSRSGLHEMFGQARRFAPEIVFICGAEAVLFDSTDPLLFHIADYARDFAEKVFEDVAAGRLVPTL